MTNPQKPKRQFSIQLREIIKLFASGKFLVLVVLLALIIVLLALNKVS